MMGKEEARRRRQEESRRRAGQGKRGSKEKETRGEQGRGKPCPYILLLLVVFDGVFVAQCGFFGVEVEFSAGAALSQEVPTLV
jgi:hypothetical protein